MEAIRNVKITPKHSWDAATLPAEIRSKMDEFFERPDEYMVYSCADAPAIYTVGMDHDPTGYQLDLPIYTLPRNGNLSYQGPGVLAIVMILNFRSILGCNIHAIIDAILDAVKNFALVEHGIELHFKDTDPGLYDADDNKIFSIDLDITRPYMLYYLSANILVPDFKPLQAVDICGISNRKFANLLKVGTSIDNVAMDLLASKLLNYIWKNLYPDHHVNTV